MASEPRCSKPGCGALKIVGKPCTDADCPQQWVHHTDTRPAPAATDTGLETVAENLARTIWGYFKGGPDAIAWFDNNKSLGGPAWLIEQCHSQAEELLAAEREKKTEIENAWLEALVSISELKADNAQQAARINGFEGFLDDLAEILGCERDIGDVVNELDAINNRAEALEAKLAAAEEVAQLVIQAEEDKSGDPNFYILLMQTAYDKARAVLGEKPS